MRINKLAVIGLSLSASFAIGVGVAWPQSGGEDPPSSPGDGISTLPMRYEDVSSDEMSQLRENMSDQDQELFDTIMAYSRDDAFPVSDSEGRTRGYIPNDVRRAPAPQTAEDLGEVVDDAGDLVGYWGGDLGFLERDVVEAAGFDLAEYRLQSGQPGPDGTEG